MHVGKGLLSVMGQGVGRCVVVVWRGVSCAVGVKRGTKPDFGD